MAFTCFCHVFNIYISKVFLCSIYLALHSDDGQQCPKLVEKHILHSHIKFVAFLSLLYLKAFQKNISSLAYLPCFETFQAYENTFFFVCPCVPPSNPPSTFECLNRSLWHPIPSQMHTLYISFPSICVSLCVPYTLVLFRTSYFYFLI